MKVVNYESKCMWINKYRDYVARKKALRKGRHNWTYREYPSGELIVRWDAEDDDKAKEFVYGIVDKMIHYIFDWRGL